MKEFHDAVVAHDGATLSSLFLPDANIWLNVLTDSAYDPEHSNIVIHRDGTIAAVYFDFVFKSDGKINNAGSETWQLVKAADGWRIAAICYSSNPPM